MFNDAFPSDAPVTLTMLGAAVSSPVHCRLIEMVGSTLLMSTPGKISLGTTVRIEGNDTLLLGEICGMEPLKDAWIIAVRIAHSLGSLADLERLNRALLGERARVPASRSNAE
jgi:hypothetical protein